MWKFCKGPNYENLKNWLKKNSKSEKARMWILLGGFRL